MLARAHRPLLASLPTWGALLLLAACGSDGAPGPGPSSSAMAKEIAALPPGEEREVDPGVFMTMHRVRATSPIEGGWHRAASTEGGFEVEVPLPFNDFRVRSEAADGVELRSHTVGGKTEGKLSWLATCIARKDGSRGPGDPAPPPDGLEPKGSPVTAWQRTVTLPDRTCVLVVEAQGAEPLPDEPARLRFLQSFRATGAPRW